MYLMTYVQFSPIDKHIIDVLFALIFAFIFEISALTEHRGRASFKFTELYCCVRLARYETSNKIMHRLYSLKMQYVIDIS